MKTKTMPQVFGNALVGAYSRRGYDCDDLFGSERGKSLKVFILSLSLKDWSSLSIDFIEDRERVIHYPSDLNKEKALRILGFCSSGPVGYAVLSRELGVSQVSIREIVSRTLRRYVRAIRYRHLFSVLTPWFERERLCLISAQPTKEEYLATDVGVLRLSTRALNVLYFAGIKTVGELQLSTAGKIWRFPNCGLYVLNEIIDEMRRAGFPLEIQKNEFPPSVARELSL